MNPLAVLFRGVISDREVAQIQALAAPKLARATVQVSILRSNLAKEAKNCI